MANDPQSIAFRNALGVFATGVTIISAHDAELGDAAITANSFNSVSLEPRLVLWSVAKNAKSLPTFIASTHYVVHILTEQQQPISNHFARSGDNKFEGITFERVEGDCPRLPDCAAYFHCVRHQAIEAGDHWLFIGLVKAFSGSSSKPLIYHGGRYANLESSDAPAWDVGFEDWTW
jgi:flavin reductase (DIM6/NTAB) family NADH-FMN oxidoreductase RutF